MTFFTGDRLRPPFLLKTADLAARLHASCVHELSRGEDLFRMHNVARNEIKKLFQIPEVAKKLPSNLWKVLTIAPFLGRTHEKNKKTNKQKKRKGRLRASCKSRSAKANSSTNKLFFFSEKRQNIFCHLSLLNEVSNHSFR